MLGKEKDKALRRLLLDQQASGLTDEAISREVGCALRTVSYRKRKIAAELEKAAAHRATRETVRSADRISRSQQAGWMSGAETARDILAAFPGAETLGPDENMRLLSIMAQHGPDATRVSASNALESLRRQYATTDSLGPKPPLLPDERIDRLARLFEGSTPAEVQAAVEKTWPDSLASLKIAPPSASGGTTPTTSTATSAPSSPTAKPSPPSPASAAPSAGS